MMLQCKLTVACMLLYAFIINGALSYNVTGNKIYDDSGKLVRFRGINKPSFEWSPAGEHASLSDYTLMKAWGANIVRIPMNQGFWLSGSSVYNAQYAATIAQQVSWIKSLGMGVILDLHWSDKGDLTSTPNQQCMADANSVTFWTQVAIAYKNDPMVMFELYNEPRDIQWRTWLNGGNECGYEVKGMQQLYNAIRATGANNVIIVGGLDWAFDLSNVTSNLVSGRNIAYNTHPYDYSSKQASTWNNAFGYLAKDYPVIATEFGQYCNTGTYAQDLISYMESKGIHWVAWAWYVQGCNFPSIISDWNGTPASGVGVLVKTVMGSSGSNLTTTSGAYTTTTTTTSGGSNGPVTSTTVYDDSLTSNWQSYGWAGDLSFTTTEYVHSGSNSISFSPSNYAAVYLHTTSPFESTSYDVIQFYVNGGSSSGQNMKVLVYGNSSPPTVIGSDVNFPLSVAANSWTLISIRMKDFGVSGQITGFAIQAATSANQPKIYIDDITLGVSGGTTTGSSSTTGTTSTTGASTTTTPPPTTTTTTPPPTTTTPTPTNITTTAPPITTTQTSTTPSNKTTTPSPTVTGVTTLTPTNKTTSSPTPTDASNNTISSSTQPSYLSVATYLHSQCALLLAMFAGFVVLLF